MYCISKGFEATYIITTAFLEQHGTSQIIVVVSKWPPTSYVHASEEAITLSFGIIVKLSLEFLLNIARSLASKLCALCHLRLGVVCCLIKVCGCYLVCFPCSSTPTNQIYTIKVVLHWQIYNETFVKTRLKNQTSSYLVMVIISARLLIS